MVAEPMTSPVNKQRQIFYGFFVALMSILLVIAIRKNILPSNIPDSSLLVLLLGNLLFFSIDRIQEKNKVRPFSTCVIQESLKRNFLTFTKS